MPASPDATAAGPVRRGTHLPHWKCGCGFDKNWASRIRCRECDRNAPQRVIAKAHAADLAAASTSKDANGPASGKRSKPSAAEMRAQGWSSPADVERLKRKLAAGSASPVVESQDASQTEHMDEEPAAQAHPKLSDLLEFARVTAKVFGEESEQHRQATEQVAAAKSRRDSTKAPSIRVRDAERNVERRRKAMDAATDAETAAQQKLLEAQKVVATAEDTVRRRREEFATAEQALRDVLASAAPGAAETASGLDVFFMAADEEFGGTDEAVAALNVLRDLHAKQAAEREQRAALQAQPAAVAPTSAVTPLSPDAVLEQLSAILPMEIATPAGHNEKLHQIGNQLRELLAAAATARSAPAAEDGEARKEWPDLGDASHPQGSCFQVAPGRGGPPRSRNLFSPYDASHPG